MKPCRSKVDSKSEPISLTFQFLMNITLMYGKKPEKEKLLYGKIFKIHTHRYFIIKIHARGSLLFFSYIRYISYSQTYIVAVTVAVVFFILLYYLV